MDGLASRCESVFDLEFVRSLLVTLPDAICLDDSASACLRRRRHAAIACFRKATMPPFADYAYTKLLTLAAPGSSVAHMGDRVFELNHALIIASRTHCLARIVLGIKEFQGARLAHRKDALQRLWIHLSRSQRAIDLRTPSGVGRVSAAAIAKAAIDQRFADIDLEGTCDDTTSSQDLDSFSNEKTDEEEDEECASQSPTTLAS